MMRAGSSVPSIYRSLAGLVLLAALITAQAVSARSPEVSPDRQQRYIIELQDPPLALYAGRQLAVSGGLESTDASSTKSARGAKLDLRAAANRDYLEFIAGRQEAFRQSAGALLGRQLQAVHRYRLATNGMAVDLSKAEAAALADSPDLKSITPDRRFKLQTDAGPEWIGAGNLWGGLAGFPEARGENVVVGVIDSGINWEHPSFDDALPGGYNYTNPLGELLGLCDDPEVSCNNKLIGIYDFVEDDPATEDVVEENTKGRDNDSVGHGTHVASTAVGNRLNVFLNDSADSTLSGVAPHANLVTYRVCYVGEPAGPDSGGCMGSAILAAIDQATEDGVDVINYSIGSEANNPWTSQIAKAFLNAREAGIFVVASAGNDGPHPGSVGSPANAPWIIAAGNATHNRSFVSLVQNLIGGDTTPPEDLVGVSQTGGTGQLQIVHARDYGFALCGVGEAELESDCDGNLGLSNPWDGQKPFNGEIVVCDRGTYGRVEKGKNVLLAGAGGYILANTDEFGESLVSDEHCLPASHVGKADGDTLRAWLASGRGHGGSISGFSAAKQDRFGDRVAGSSARGPAEAPVEDTLKPNLIAPGTSILAASNEGQEFRLLSGTSMSSPHIAGAAALLKSVHGDWSASQLASAIEMTATAELATVNGAKANSRERGAGRPQLGEAANAGLFLNVTGSQFNLANPAVGGDPGSLNLPGLVNAGCYRNCSFNRTVTDQMGGGNWTANALDFPAGVSVSVNPSSFTLANGASQALSVSVDLDQAGIVGEWVDGRVRLSAAGSPDQYLTVSVFADGGSLPDSWSISDERDGGWKTLNLSGLVALPDATFRSGGLQPAERTAQVLVEDPTPSDPYDGGEGVFTQWHALPQGGLWLHAETLASTAEDLDLFVGRDENGNGFAEKFEELCSSTTPQDIERCDLYDLPAGDYWIVVQNWSGTNPEGDEATLLSAGIAEGDGSLAASGPGRTVSGEAISLRLSWDNLAALPGEEWLGAIGIGTRRETPNNIGVIPVRFTRSAIGAPATFPLYNGVDHQVALDGGQAHDRLFIDVPPGASSLTVSVEALDAEMNDGLELELRRLGFDAALVDPPFAASPAGAAVIGSDSGSGGTGPSVTVSGGSLQAGRWYAVTANGNDSPVAVEVRADVAFAGSALPTHRGLWYPRPPRDGIRQGYDYNWGESDRALIWYSFEEDGQPAWYIAGSPTVSGNIWVSDLYRVTNDGTQQQLATVGKVSITALAEDDQLFTFTLFGQSGTDRMQPSAAQTCPQVDGSERSYTGLWYRGVDGLGGASVVVNANNQAQIHYLFDDSGRPRWLFAGEEGLPPNAPEIPMLQFTGYCALCDGLEPTSEPAGVLSREFSSETAGSWMLDYLFQPPLSGSVERTDQIIKLTDTLDCL